MIKRYFFEQKTGLKKYLFFIFLLSITINAQYNSSAYLSIRDSTVLSSKIKEFKIDSLLYAQTKDSIVSSLAYDLYDYAIWHYLNNDEEKAIIASKNFVKIIDSLPSFDKEIYKAALNNLGFFYGNKNDYFNAYMVYKKLCTVGIPDQYAANAYRLAGRNLRSLGDFYMAADYFENSIDVAKKIKDTRVFILNSVDASINYKEMATSEGLKRSVEILSKAIETTNNLKNDLSNEPIIISDADKFMVYNHLGNALNDRDDYDFERSLLNYNESLTLALKNNDPKLLSVAYNDLGYLYLHDKKKEALKYFNKALKQQPDVETHSIIYANISTYYLKSKAYDRSLFNIQKAINVLSHIEVNDYQSLPTKDAIATCTYKFELLQNLIGKADIWLDFYQNESTNGQLLTNALETLKLADSLVDIIRFESNEVQSKLFWRKTASEIYTNAVKVCFYLKDTEKAFYFMEKNKALLLLEDLSLREQREYSTIPESIHQRQFDLRSKILNYTTLLSSTKKKDSIRPILLTSKEAYSSFIDSLQIDFKFYYRTQKPAQTITINQAQEKLTDTKEVYIEYLLGEDEGYGLLITKESTQFFKIENYNTLLTNAEKFRSLLEEPLKTQKDKENYTSVAFSLYKSLFPEKVSQQIIGKKLILITDSYLQNIPFEALLTSKEADSYFIKQHTINYAYSLSFLDQNKNWNRNNTNDFIGFAPINFSGGLSNLSQSEQEMKTANALFSSTSFLYADATKQNFIENVKGCTIVHIASHSNATDIRSPWIVFDDKKLSLDELYLTENTADLVVLSACKTSIGSLKEGEGVMSLARGFFNTGANSVLSTLWNVNDATSAEIMKIFYKEIKKGSSKSDALHAAKLNYLNSHQLSERSPYYWASFVLIGDNESIQLSGNNTFFLKAVLVFIVFIILTFLYKKRKTIFFWVTKQLLQ